MNIAEFKAFNLALEHSGRFHVWNTLLLRHQVNQRFVIRDNKASSKQILVEFSNSKNNRTLFVHNLFHLRGNRKISTLAPESSTISTLQVLDINLFIIYIIINYICIDLCGGEREEYRWKCYTILFMELATH